MTSTCIIVASLRMTSLTAHLRSAGVCGSVMKTSQIWTCRHTSDYAREAVWESVSECARESMPMSESVHVRGCAGESARVSGCEWACVCEHASARVWVLWCCWSRLSLVRECAIEWESERVRVSERVSACERACQWVRACASASERVCAREREHACECERAQVHVRGCACERVCERECAREREHARECESAREGEWESAREWLWESARVWECCGAVDPDYLSWESARVWAMMTVFCTWSTCKACMIIMVSTLELSSVNICTITLC